MLLKILIALVLVVVVLAVIVMMQPGEFRITRSVSISAPPDAVFAQVNDLHKWEAWSPWAKLDPAAKTSYEGAASGSGAIFNWAGNNQVGEGRMTIIESHPDDLVRFKIDFVKPFAGTNIAEFTFKPEGAQTVVTWSMSGQNNLMGKAFSLVVNCDKMIGGQFEKGLTDLKSVVETEAKK